MQHMRRRMRAEKAIEQFSLVDALLAGLFDGVFPVSAIRKRGTLGLGCGDHMDGELVVLGDDFRLFHGDGSMTLLPPDAELAFAEVVDFEPESTALLEAVPDLETLLDEVRGRVPSANLFHAVRFDCHLGSVSLREAKRQSKPYLPLAEAVHDQREVVVEDVAGTLLGFVAPTVFQGVTVAGAHFHFVDVTGQIGGHVLGLTEANGELQLETYSAVTVRLPHSLDYLEADLDLEATEADRAIRHAESDHQR